MSPADKSEFGTINRPLLWQPIWSQAQEQFDKCNASLSLLIAPFIQLDALKAVVESLPSSNHLQVITRWNPQDLASGVSDVEVYPYLKAQGIALYTQSSLHMKLFACESGDAVLTSANITRSGLGLRESPNTEIATPIKLQAEDMAKLQDLFRSSDLVTDETYALAKQYAQDNKAPRPKLPKLTLPKPSKRPFSILDLPAMESPEAFIRHYTLEDIDSLRYQHDLTLLKLLPGLPTHKLGAALEQGFLEIPFVGFILEHIEQEESIGFGKLTKLVHDACKDDPAPYRKDVKTLVQNLICWLDQLSAEISVTRPRYAQIIHWNGQSYDSTSK